MSAQTSQQTLTGGTVRERPPSHAAAAVLDRLPADTPMPPSVAWVAIAEQRDTKRVLRWIERAAAEEVI